VGTVLIQPSSLSQVVYRIGDTLKVVYGIDPVPIYRSIGVNPDGPGAAGERQPNRVIDAMFDAAARASGDPALGLRVGLQSEPRHFFVLGHAWLASATLADAFRALLRYEAILNSGHTDLCFERQGEHYVLREAYPNPADYPGKLRVDTGIASVLRMCYFVRGETLYPTRLDLYSTADVSLDIYREIIRGPVRRSSAYTALYFRASELDAALSGAIPELVDASCRIAERYLASADTGNVAHQVRTQLVQMLPGGGADQEQVAAKLYRSASTLQRQLTTEGTSYRHVLDTTRRELAEAYLRDARHSQAETAFLLGFADQSNFARAFKRWTKMTPGQYRKETSRRAL
jgi:AraC-like DNA-binding protein